MHLFIFGDNKESVLSTGFFQKAVIFCLFEEIFLSKERKEKKKCLRRDTPTLTEVSVLWVFGLGCI
ncbi:hypothetical protein WKT22_01807 [Candidatus Lokiarchaeum ossiferum]